MLKILIIDDDLFIRKGIQMMMPWKEHQMEIIGEASNGKEALNFLSTHTDTDLALVDIDMPIMNGTDFIKEASRLYPHLSYVVLTVHTEFEYVQEILRLGAIDYIAKTQFDQENFDAILNRIQAGISKKTAASSSSLIDWKASKILYSEIYALISLYQEDESELLAFFVANSSLNLEEAYELQKNIWIFPGSQKDFSFPEDFTHTMLLEISDVYEMAYSELLKILRRYLKNQFFYDYLPLQKVNHKHVYELIDDVLVTSEETLNAMKSKWISMNWIYENELFDQFRIDLKNCHLTPSQLYHFLLNLEMIWNGAYSDMTGEPLKLPSSFSNWYEVENWLLSVYEKAQLFRSDSKYSNEVIRNILSAQSYIDNNYHKPLQAAEIARSISMSYGYFSRCFHDVIGQSFSDYCISLRIKRAKTLLENTNQTVLSIAFSVGYEDEKYFSRIFKKSTGMSPSKYRKSFHV